MAWQNFFIHFLVIYSLSIKDLNLAKVKPVEIGHETNKPIHLMNKGGLGHLFLHLWNMKDVSLSLALQLKAICHC